MRGVLFLCTGNSCRSQMAEGLAKVMFPEEIQVFSAGTDPQGVNPKAIKVMQEIGIDISDQNSEHVKVIPIDEVGTVITLCGDANENCPVFPDSINKIHWGLKDPANATGSADEVLAEFRRVRDEIKERISDLLQKK